MVDHGAVTTTTSPTDAAAIDAARAALVDEAGIPDVGEHLGAVLEDTGAITHRFASLRGGYVGWAWSVTVNQLPGAAITVDEIVLMPGEDAIIAPAWVPYRERIQPGDLSAGDLLPVADDDPRLVPTYSFGDDPLDQDAREQIRAVSKDLGLGRIRTLGQEGFDAVAERWYEGQGGPDSPLAQAAPDQCHSCGFLVRLNGPLGVTFGVCANGDASDDGRVVSLNHGCGAHSEVRLAKRHEALPLSPPVWDTLTPDDLDRL